MSWVLMILQFTYFTTTSYKTTNIQQMAQGWFVWRATDVLMFGIPEILVAIFYYVGDTWNTFDGYFIWSDWYYYIVNISLLTAAILNFFYPVVLYSLWYSVYGAYFATGMSLVTYQNYFLYGSIAVWAVWTIFSTAWIAWPYLFN